MLLEKKFTNPKIHSARPSGFFHRTIHYVFNKMDQGGLTMEMPDGREFFYGTRGDGQVNARIRIRRPVFFKKCVLFGDVGFGESFVDGDWETDDIQAVIEWMILNVEKHPTLMGDQKRWSPVNFLKLVNVGLHKFRMNTLSGSRKNIAAHYDLSNDFFKLLLDPTMTYSSAYFDKPDLALEEAQRKKYDVLCRKLALKSSDHVLEVGTGWGGFALHAAKNYGCRVTSITVSHQQYAYAIERVRETRLGGHIDVRLQDYRHLRGKFDKIVSIEMIEAVGHRFLPIYFKKLHDVLKKDGLLALQMILSPDHRYDSFRKNVDWIQKHIFPGSLLPSISRIQKSINRTGTLCLVDFEDMTTSYVRTLVLWQQNFNQNIREVMQLGFDENFVRKWNYYLSYCAAAFQTRNIFVAQAVFSRPNNKTLALRAGD